MIEMKIISRRLLDILIPLLLTIALAACTGADNSSNDSGSNAGSGSTPPPVTETPEDPNESNQEQATTLTNPDSYIFLTVTDSNGIADITDGLAAYGYVDSQRFGVEVIDSHGRALPNMNIAYGIDPQRSKIRLRSVDSTGRHIPHYMLREIDLSAEIPEFEPQLVGGIIRLLFRFFVRAARAFDTASTVYDLLNLVVEYTQEESEVVYTGVLEGVCLALDLTERRALRHLPKIPKDTEIAEASNLEIAANLGNGRKAAVLQNARAFCNSYSWLSDMIAYLREVGGYSDINEDSQVRLNLHSLDGEARFLTIEVLNENSPPENSGASYTVKVTIEGNRAVDFDNLSDPDFSGTMIVRGERFEIRKQLNSYTNIDFIENVRLTKGERVEVLLIEEDVFIDDKVASFNFNFNGASKTLQNNLATIHIDFLAGPNSDINDSNNVGENSPPHYNMTVDIRALEGVDYDFLSDPDFAGVVVISGEKFEIQKRQDSLFNSAEFQDLAIEYGEVIRVTVYDIDLLSDDILIEFSFIFQGESYREQNDLVDVNLQFTRL